ncbi:MAG: DNA polymerase IV [Candidatus Omnitrophota bacterium]
MTTDRTIIHIDMDAFFAAVEERDDPSLKGKAIGVIGANTRTVLVTASYEARKYGVKTGMNVPEAKAACPHILLVRANHEKYTKICGQIVEMLDGFSPLVEIFSIDEFFVDAAGLSKIFGPPLEMADKIKRRIKDETGLTASVGIGPNKLIAKLASDMCKPDGIKYIKAAEVSKTLKDLPVEELCGIGRSTKNALRLMNIKSCGELGRTKQSILTDRFGVVGEKLFLMGRGIDDSPVMPFRKGAKEKSMGHSMTLTRDISDKKELLKHLLRLSDMVGTRLRRQGMTGNTVSVTIRYKSFKTFQKQKSIEMPTSSTKVIFGVVKHIINSLKLAEPVRLVGVSVQNLRESFPVLSLFKEDEKPGKLDKARDTINNIFGTDTIQFASIIDLKSPDKVISPSWRPHGARRY